MISTHDAKNNNNNCPWITDVQLNSKLLQVPEESVGEDRFGHRVRTDPLRKPAKLRLQGRDG